MQVPLDPVDPDTMENEPAATEDHPETGAAAPADAPDGEDPGDADADGGMM